MRWLAQQSEILPVFPANREFCKIATSGAPEIANNGAVYRASDANSLLNGTGNCFRGTGNLWRENRKYIAGIEVTAG